LYLSTSLSPRRIMRRRMRKRKRKRRIRMKGTKI
jgi:hypothetical protein